jgi:hypothetical protein
MNSYKVKRDSNGLLTENCPVSVGFKIGSFDCTATCRNNQNSKKEIQTLGFEVPIIKCSERSKLSKESEQLTIEI